MKCKDCTEAICPHRTTDGETECYYYQYAQPISVAEINKAQWIADTAIKLIAQIPYEYVSSCNGQVNEPRHIYAARIAKEMADVIYGKEAQ